MPTILYPAKCPEGLRVNQTAPMVHVADVDRATAFYALLGFQCESRFTGTDGITNWVKLVSDKATLMLARATAPIIASQQAVLFYMYAPDVEALRLHLLAEGIPDAGEPNFEDPSFQSNEPQAPAVFRVVTRFYMPEGELRVHDLDGYCILIGQLG